MECNNSNIASFPMIGGEGPHSYAKNSSYQGGGLHRVKTLLYKEITKKFDVKLLCSSSDSFNIADLGCSVGPNTFIIVNTIIEAVEFTFQSQGLNLQDIAFQVFFNDHTDNDFNTLFKSLPPERNYYAAGVPGTFYGRLFPRAKLQFILSSYSLQWLSRIPMEVLDKSSTAWNKMRIDQSGSKEVGKAYSSQFANDVETFLRARAAELVPGGFIALILPCIPSGANLSKCSLIAIHEVLHLTLMDLAKKGLVEEAEVDTFNLSYYLTSPAELECLIQLNGSFKMERMDELVRPTMDVKKFALGGLRAILEGIIRVHFGSKIIDELFNHYTEKVIASNIFLDSSSYLPMYDLFVILKRNIDDEEQKSLPIFY